MTATAPLRLMNPDAADRTSTYDRPIDEATGDRTEGVTRSFSTSDVSSGPCRPWIVAGKIDDNGVGSDNVVRDGV
jgi:hypothetical protein